MAVTAEDPVAARDLSSRDVDQAIPRDDSQANAVIGANLKSAAAGWKQLAGGQCYATMVGRYILVRQFFGGTLDVTDTASGESMCGPLEIAMWIS